jgi:ECF sigma factor
MSDATHILTQIEAGDPRAAEKLLPLVYDDTDAFAHQILRFGPCTRRI